MNNDDRDRKLSVTFRIGADLSPLSADEITALIALLRAEMTRLEAGLEAKAADRNLAEALFRPKG
jgi:uncharacterized small protein (DUF1192 family)